MKKTKSIFIFLFSFLFFSCNSDTDNLAEDAAPENIMEEYNYSKDPNIVYSVINAERAFSNKGEMIELANGMFVKKIGEDSYIFDSDMFLTESQVQELELFNEINAESTIQTRGTTARDAKTWANKTVYYSFNSNVTPEFKTEILAGIQSWREQSQLIFVERTNQNDHVEFILGTDGSYSNVGRIGGKQYIYLDKRWANRGTAMHEIGHAVGLIHEHQHAQFHLNLQNPALVFKWDNISSSSKSNYTKYPKSHDGFICGMYDYNYPINSLMIYGSYSGDAIDPSKPVMTYNTIGIPGYDRTYSAQRSYLSTSDRWAVAEKYGYKYDPKTDPNLPPI